MKPKIISTVSVVRTVEHGVQLDDVGIEAILRAYVGAPPDAQVSFDCTYGEFLKGARVSWTERTDETDEGAPG